MKRVANFCMLTLIFLFFFGKTNAQNLPKDGLIAWFPFNGTLKDESGNGLNTFFANNNNKGGIALSEVNNLTDDRNGKAKSAFYFSGDNENKAIKVKLAKSLNLRDRTVALWVNNPSKSITHYSNIFELGYNSEIKQYCSILGDESSYVSQKRDGKISCLIAEGGFVESRSYLNDDNWHHIAVVVNSLNNSYKIYIDGKLDSDSYLPIPITNYSNPYSSNPQKPISEIPVNYLVFGNVFRNDPQCAFAGKIDDIGLWNRALSDSEIFQLFDNFYTTNSTSNIRTDSRIKQFGQNTNDNVNLNNSTLNKSVNLINNERQSNGQETYTWANGDKYVGEFRNGKKNGQGTYTWANGDKYVGEWRDDNINGKGIYTFSNGIIQEGTYENGNFIEGKKEVVVQNIQPNNNSFKPTYEVNPNSASIVGNPIKIGRLEVAQFDFPNKMNWENAKAACVRIGNYWRLPTKDELQILYETIDQPLLYQKLGGPTGTYWSSTAYEENPSVYAWIKDFVDGRWYHQFFHQQFSVRPVRDLANVNPVPVSYTVASIKGIIGNPIKIGSLEVAQNDFSITMSCSDAKAACAKLGKGWRLPTEVELNLLYKNQDKIGGFANHGSSFGFCFWSTTAIQFFTDGRANYADNGVNCNVRAVRSLGNVNSTATKPRNQERDANVPSGVGGFSQQELLNLIIKSQLSDDASGLDPSSQFYSKPSNSNSRNSSSSSSSNTSNSTRNGGTNNQVAKPEKKEVDLSYEVLSQIVSCKFCGSPVTVKMNVPRSEEFKKSFNQIGGLSSSSCEKCHKSSSFTYEMKAGRFTKIK